MAEQKQSGAGPELDALIAEKVMGWEKIPTKQPDCYGPWKFRRDDGQMAFVQSPGFPWSPSTHISAAWEVVKYRLAQGAKPILWWDSDRRLWKANLGYTRDGVAVLDEAETAPLAICQAALAAVREAKGGENG